METEFSKARNAFFASEEGQRLCFVATLRTSLATNADVYLKNRLDAAFAAGWNAREAAMKKGGTDGD